ncbi:hypothetical protein PIB30_010378 [Stylosanthes scabra]|uniref:Uncharacterized protein n=1 Tax=Stylosanthes scabra TaxID=79078 RepID=A0ABU6W500_9FABA|nr:hypothetical protein [Stylosanthes scabra]
MRHALLIFVLMTEGDVNLPQIMRDILLVRPTKHPRHLLSFPMFITRLDNRYEVPEFPNDKFHTIRPVDMQPHSQEQQKEQPPPPEPEQRPSTSTTPSAPT